MKLNIFDENKFKKKIKNYSFLIIILIWKMRIFSQYIVIILLVFSLILQNSFGCGRFRENLSFIFFTVPHGD